MTGFKRFRLVLLVLPIVMGIGILKMLVHHFQLEFLAAEGLIPSVVAGAIFLIGFLLSHVLSDYKEAERTVGDMRVALETIYEDIAAFARTKPEFEFAPVRKSLIDFVDAFEAGLGLEGAHAALGGAIAKVDVLFDTFAALEAAGMSERYIVRLRAAHDVLRRALYRIAYMQRMQFVPSVHVMVQTLVVSCIFLMLFLKTTAVVEAGLVIGFVSYMFVYAVILIEQLEKPFRTGEATVDDVSIFLLHDFVETLKAA